MSKLPIVIVRGPSKGGSALNTLPDDMFVPSLADILPYAPPIDRSEINDSRAPGSPANRIGYA